MFQDAQCRQSINFLPSLSIIFKANSIIFSILAHAALLCNFTYCQSAEERIDGLIEYKYYRRNLSNTNENFLQISSIETAAQNGTLFKLWLNLEQGVRIRINLALIEHLWDDDVVHVIKDKNHNSLDIRKGHSSRCHYKSLSESILASVSNCEGRLNGIIIVKNDLIVLDNFTEEFVDKHEISTREQAIALDNFVQEDTNSFRNRSRRSIEPRQQFCGNTYVNRNETVDILPETLGVVSSGGWMSNWWQNLIVEMAVFADQTLWEQFQSKHGYQAYTHLQDFIATILNNVQIFYQHSSLSPKISFKVVRFVVFKNQPYELRGLVDAKDYLDAFCTYQSRWGGKSWDHAVLFTGLDLVRSYNDHSISGIARMQGVCDSTHSCLISEAANFRAAFITAHEIGHGLGMMHDEPICGDSFIMSESLGAGKVVWSSCSVNDLHKHLNTLNNENKNCLMTQRQNAVLDIHVPSLPGQKYDTNKQCQMVFGKNYYGAKGQFLPQMVSDICRMIWCHHVNDGVYHASHPALEGTVCGFGRHCISGKCIYARNDAVAPVHGGWSSWSELDCRRCTCPEIVDSLSITKSTRSCTNPRPGDKGNKCQGSALRGIVCKNNGRSTCSFQQRNGKQMSLNEYLQARCTASKVKSSDNHLLGSGAQLLYSDEKSCKVFCLLNTQRGIKSFRFFGDYLPDGTPCGAGKYCLDGTCLPLSCNGKALLPTGQSCDLVSTACQREKRKAKTVLSKIVSIAQETKWTGWSEWSQCSLSCGSGVKTRSRQCYEAITYKSSTSCSDHGAEKVSCLVSDCPSAYAKDNQEAATKRPPPVTQTIIKWKSVTYGAKSYWTQWSQCSVTCGSGVQYRYTTCYDSTQCPASNTQDRPCYPSLCTSWGGWGYWSNCVANGIRRRVRMCYGASPTDTCLGSPVDMQYC